MDDDAPIRVDLLGFLCPIPVHETRRVLKGCAHGDKIEVICDDPETLHDIPALCARKGYACKVIRGDDQVFTFIISKYKTHSKPQGDIGTIP